MIIDLELKGLDATRNLVGPNNSNIKTIEGLYNVKINLVNEQLYINSDNQIFLNNIALLFKKLVEVVNLGNKISPRDIVYLNNLVKEGNENKFLDLYQNKKAIVYTYNNKPIFPKTVKQIEYIKLLDIKDIVFALGAAGTGKTYLAISYAVSLFKKGLIGKIILTRPAVEAGESLGFLPGDLKEKVDPYLRPLYDALYDTLGLEQTESLISKNIIEIAPLAYMRGRTLENAFIILDEAQNASILQIKMFLTRLGFNSKMVITGDPSQVDLRDVKMSGLAYSAKLLADLQEIGIIDFTSTDVVRHPLVSKIINYFSKGLIVKVNSAD